MAQQPLEGQGHLIIDASGSHSMTHTRYDLPFLGISPRDLYLTTHNTQKETDIHVPIVIRTCIPSKRLAADPRLSFCLVNLLFWRFIVYLTFLSVSPNSVFLLWQSYKFYRGADKSLTRPDWKNNWKVAIFRPTRMSLLPRRSGWTDNILNFF